MILILGYYGSMTLQLGPNCSRLIQPNSLFVQSIKVNIAANVISPFFGFCYCHQCLLILISLLTDRRIG